MNHTGAGSAAQTLAQRLADQTAVVGVIGLGYVGLPAAHALHRGGLRVIGFDIDPAKIEALDRGEQYLEHLGQSLVDDLSGSDRFSATTDMGRLGEADAILVCVPTPLGPHREPDLSYVEGAGRAVGRSLRRGQLVVLESTTYPGTTRGEFLGAILEGAGERAHDLTPGRDFFLAFSPEREDPGNAIHTTRTIPKVVGGLDETSTQLAASLYAIGVETVCAVASAEVAEAAKLLENIFRAVNIALVNEMKVVLSEMGVDVWEVIRAASTKPFGFMPFYPGPGLGGHCIPIDPFYLTWKAKEVGRPTRFIELAGEVNTAMPEYVVHKTALALNERGRAVRGSRVLVLGLAYKPDIDDTRESPSFELIQRLRDLGAEVDYADPHVPRALPVRKHDLGMTAVEPTPEALASYDCVLIATAHKAFDYAAIAEHARLVVDTRDAMRPWADALGDRLVRA
ncbi:MAG: nucleotide sugar dehydrogenase [Planctomycetota bacterium]|nr:MAG: nucleotide sugar dehydrogenase [Planctomycetota bacterium]